MMRRSLALTGAVAIAAVGLGAAQLAPGAAPRAAAAGLTAFDDCDDLLDHYRDQLAATASAWGFGGQGGMAVLEGSAGGAERQAAGDTGAVGGGPTGTNLQEQGVDEPDVAKLVDGRLVVLTGDRLRVLAAQARPELLGSLRLGASESDGYGWGGELLVTGERALVVRQGHRLPEQAEDPSGSSDVGDAARSVMPVGTPTTRLSLVDLSQDQPRLLEEATYDGQYVSARLVDGTVRLVTTTWPRPEVVMPSSAGAQAEIEAAAANVRAARSVTLDDVLPQMERRGADGSLLESGRAVACDRTSHAGDASGAATLLVVTMRPDDGLAATDRTAVTTDGDLVYASADRLYVATSRWGTSSPVVPLAGDRSGPPEGEVSTEVHAFDTTSAGSTRYVGSGSVPGYVLGRWALSHHDDALRVATTLQPPWEGEATGATSSMVVVLTERGDRLVETGRVGGLGRTEHIKAVRYFGELAAVVTFRQTDPLYLLALAGDPRVLGELKIPGFSTYLHPLGDGLLLGLGYDATGDGMVTGVQASVFDISEPSRPRQVDRLRLGEGWAAALDDSRAFTYDPSRRVASFAFAAYDPSAVDGQTVTALGLSVSSNGTLRRAGSVPLDRDSWTTRVLVGDDHLFAVSETGVVTADADTWTRTGSVSFTG